MITHLKIELLLLNTEGVFLQKTVLAWNRRPVGNFLIKNLPPGRERYDPIESDQQLDDQRD